MAGLLSYGLYYYAPAMLGMKTGYPLYVVGSSTFGTAGGYLMPGLLMGVLQIGWFAVGTFFATKFILSGLGSGRDPGTLPSRSWRWSGATRWRGSAPRAFSMSPRSSLYLNGIAFLMLLVVFIKTRRGLSSVHGDPAKAAPFAAFTLLVQA